MITVIADTGVLISLGLIGKINLIEEIFGNYYIANAVWQEFQKYDNPLLNKEQFKFLDKRVVEISTKNYLSVVLDYGESESIILYEELKADFLLIDDKKARLIAESLNVNCIGSIGILIRAKQKGLIKEIRPIFEIWMNNERYFSLKLLNQILLQEGEDPIFE
jgi:predicted nucleic acid-binding protein